MSDIIHGDIKPQNLLVFNHKRRSHIIKVADFGYSTRWASTNDLIQMPRSEPWTALEWHHRGFTPAQAKLFDVYSFGMLVLWLLSYGTHDDSNRYFEIGFHACPDIWELKSRVVKHTFQTQKLNLGQFFNITLTQDTTKRCSNFLHLRLLLANRK